MSQLFVRDDWTGEAYPTALAAVRDRVIAQGYWNDKDLYDFGAAAGYPRCCILDFVCDSQHGRPAGLIRGTTPLPPHYVPCRMCASQLTEQ